jgi:hypothetical protein
MHPVRKRDYRARPLQYHTNHAVRTFSLRGSSKKRMASSCLPVGCARYGDAAAARPYRFNNTKRPTGVNWGSIRGHFLIESTKKNGTTS